MAFISQRQWELLGYMHCCAGISKPPPFWSQTKDQAVQDANWLLDYSGHPSSLSQPSPLAWCHIGSAPHCFGVDPVRLRLRDI